MTANSQADSLLVQRIREGDGSAWGDLIARYEGRLLAFVESRLGRRGPSEDIVQETFVGFLNSLPNYDGRRALESYLFSICAYACGMKPLPFLNPAAGTPAVPMPPRMQRASAPKRSQRKPRGCPGSRRGKSAMTHASVSCPTVLKIAPTDCCTRSA